MQFEQYRTSETPILLKKRPNTWNQDGGVGKGDEALRAKRRLMKRSLSSNMEYRIRQENNESIRIVTELGKDAVCPNKNNRNTSSNC